MSRISTCACSTCAPTADASVCAVVDYNFSCFDCLNPARDLDVQFFSFFPYILQKKNLKQFFNTV